MIRLVIDTNLWISAFISPSFRKRLLSICKLSSIVILIDEELLDEVVEVASRPKFSKYVTKETIEILVDAINQRSELISIISDINLCRDKKDNFLLNLSKDGKADFLITGDKDLLVLNPFETTQILTLTDFEKILFINNEKVFESTFNISNFNEIGLLSYGLHKTEYDNLVIKQTEEKNYVEDAFDFLSTNGKLVIDHNGIETSHLTKYIPIEIVDNQNILSTKTGEDASETIVTAISSDPKSQPVIALVKTALNISSAVIS